MSTQQETKTNSAELISNPLSERNIISICLGNPDKIIEVEGEELFPEHFGVKANRYIFTAMLYLYSKQAKPEPMAIYEILSSGMEKSVLEEMGGLEYLVLLKDTRVPEENLKMYCGKVKQSYTRRNLYDIAVDAKDFMVSEAADKLNPQELIAKVNTKLEDLSLKTSSTTEVYKMGDNLDERMKQREEHPEQVPGLETGWSKVDMYTNGFGPGDLVVVVAPSKVGKSTVITNWATNMAVLDQLPILYIDTEMSPFEQEDRILSRLSNVPHKEIVSGMYMMDTEYGLATEKVARIKDAREKIGMGNYYHVQMPNFQIEKVMALTRKFQVQFGVQALFFDYIKLPSSDTGSLQRMQEYQALGFFTSGLKDLASILQIPVITAAQTNRNDLDKELLDASDIGGSYRILQLATKLMFLNKKKEETIAKDGIQKGNLVLSIKYQRNGESDCPPIDLMAYRNILYIKEVAR